MRANDESESFPLNQAPLLPSLEVTIALVVLLLSLGYALLFSHLVWISLAEQHLHPSPDRLRFEGPPHFHTTSEWLLLCLPAALGWAGVLGCSSYLWQCWRHR